MGHAFGIKRGLVVNRARRHIDFAADYRAQLGFLGFGVELKHPEHGPMVGNGDRLHAKRPGLF